MVAFSDDDFIAFSGRVRVRFNVHLEDYKIEQMKRRLASLAQREGLASFVEYFGALERDSSLLSRFLNEMTINVTEVLRNPNLFESLVKEILAERFPRRDGEFKIWSAGCSYGAEAYTMAMLLDEACPGAEFSIKGTDVDLAILARANNPSFSSEDMIHVSEERRKKYFFTVDGANYLPQNQLRRRVHFSPHDLLGGVYPVNQYDLILCRNVVIYFTDDAKKRIYEQFNKALRPGGVLFVGGTERLSDHVGSGFGLIKPFFYEKKAELAAMRLAA